MQPYPADLVKARALPPSFLRSGELRHDKWLQIIKFNFGSEITVSIKCSSFKVKPHPPLTAYPVSPYIRGDTNSVKHGSASSR